MSRDKEFEKALEKSIRRRSWPDMAGFWLQDVPEIDPPGSAPEGSIEEIVSFSGLEEVLQPVKAGEVGGLTYAEVPGLRKALLRESIFLLHKAAHVISAAELNATGGRLTWSLSDGYHGALFGARAILGLLGIGAFAAQNRTVLCNIWPVRPENENKRRGLRVEHPRESSFVVLNFKLEHRHVWSILTRLLRTYSVPSWPSKIVNKIRRLEGKDFSRQRNLIHYANHAWVIGDLHQWTLDKNFGVKALSGNVNPEEGDPDFALAMGLLIFQLGLTLLGSIESRLLDQERNLFEVKFSSGWHPLFSRIFRGGPTNALLNHLHLS